MDFSSLTFLCHTSDGSNYLGSIESMDASTEMILVEANLADGCLLAVNGCNAAARPQWSCQSFRR
eukprot:scaffold102357_cov41-Prasinocladus_malaysianus.AAC.1